jgi:hypothetical protein
MQDKITNYVWTTNDAHVAKVDGYETKVINVNAGARCVALVFAGFGDGESTAKIIAAVPALLEELQKAHDVIEVLRVHCPVERYAMAVRDLRNRGLAHTDDPTRFAARSEALRCAPEG